MFRQATPLLATLAVTACSSSTSLPIESRCNPLGTGACLAPWPSSAFEIDDPATATGRRLAIPDDAIPRGAADTAIDPTRWNALDGFAPTTQILVEFATGVSSVGLPAADNMDLSLATDSPTVILDLSTGMRVAHYAEAVDQALILHPAARLTFGHRYAVAITTRVVAADGGELPISPGFRAVRDDRHTDHPLLEAMRPRVDEALEALDEAGVVDDLVVAWDFTVASEVASRSDLTAARERAIATLATYPSLYTITAESSDPVIRRRITGTLDAPLVLSNGGEPRANTRLVRDDAGLPAIQGLYRIGFSALVPACAYRSTAPVPMVLVGHAAFLDASDVHGTAATALARELCVIVVGTDLRGFSTVDVPAVKRAISDLGNADELDTIVQGVVDHTTLIVAMKTILADQLFLAGSRRLADPSRLFYAGDNLAIAALPELRRAAIVDPRADQPFASEYARGYDPIDAWLVRSLIEARWDRVQPARFEHAVLVQSAGGEATSQLARTFAWPMVDPASTPWGVRTVRSPLTGSGVALDGSAADGSAADGSAADRRLSLLGEFFATGRIAPAPM